MAIEEKACSSDDDKRAILPAGETPMTIRLSFEVHSLEEEERIVTLLSYVGVRVISSTVVSIAGVVQTANGDAPTPRT
jgi:hypothetical protein